jgi:L-aminopeptidase/D-esterase-like protein
MKLGNRLARLALAAACPLLLAPSALAAPGNFNAITDVPGVLVGHDTNRAAATGTTVLIMPQGALVGASPSGGAPGNRVTTLLEGTFQDSLRTPIFGILLNGGSIFGLQAACGVVDWLAERGLGLRFGNQTIPLVPGAIIFDLGRGPDGQAGRDVIPKECANGYRAADAAKTGVVEMGSVGAGTGARSGGLKGGLGTASTVLPDGTVIGALVVVNSGGRPYNPDDDCSLYTLWLEEDNEFGSLRRPPKGCESAQPALTSIPGTNTTIGVIATNARLSAAQVQRLAENTNDGFARAIRPAHNPGDGDTIYGVSTATPNDTPGTPGAGSALFTSLLVEAPDVYARAITHAILAAEGLGVAQTYCERFPSAKCPKAKDKSAAADSVLPVPAPPAGPAVGDGLPVVPLALALLAALLLALAAATRPGRALVARVKH